MGFFKKLGNAASSVAGTVGDVVEGVGDAIVETGKDIVNGATDKIKSGLSKANGWLCKATGKVGCRIGNFVLGGISGFFEGLRDIAIKVLDAAQSTIGIVGSLLRGDIAGVIGGLGTLIADLFEFSVNVVRFTLGGTVVGGVRDHWQAADLRSFVENLVNERFSNNPIRLGQIIQNIGLNDVSWGFDIEASHKVFKFSSRDASLWQWHQNGDIDLYAMAGLLSFDSFSPRKPSTKVRSVSRSGNISVESGIPINRWQLANYIDSDGKDGEIVVYAMGAYGTKDRIQVATSKCKKLGINLKWDDGKRFEYAVQNKAHMVSELDEYTFNRSGLGTYLVDEKLRANPDLNQCQLTALAGFRLVRGLGQTSGRSLNGGSDFSPCNATPDRTDSCCATIMSQTGAGVIHIAQWPVNVFRYVLAHEIGHYVGLCHYGHDGLQNIMYTPNKTQGLSAWDAGLYNYYLDNEPSFSQKDAKNVWRFLVSQMVPCLTGEAEGERPVNRLPGWLRFLSSHSTSANARVGNSRIICQRRHRELQCRL